MPNNQPTDADIEAEAKRWALDIAPQDTAFSPNMNAMGWWNLMSTHERTLARAHARYVLERRGRPEDVEAVEAFVRDAWIEWGRIGVDLKGFNEALARAIIDRYGPPPLREETFQVRVNKWMQHCFGAQINDDRTERNHRFIEEALELVQSGGCTASEAHQLVDYVFGRPIGEMSQEVGGVMVTLAALCNAHAIDLSDAAEVELTRVWGKSDQIKAKQAAKPKHSPLPVAWAPSPPQITDADVERCAEAIWPWLRNGLSGCRHLGWSAVSAESNGRLAAYAAASTCIGAFLNPPPPDPIQAALDRAADQVRAAGEMRTDAHEQAFRVVLGERKP